MLSTTDNTARSMRYDASVTNKYEEDNIIPNYNSEIEEKEGQQNLEIMRNLVQSQQITDHSLVQKTVDMIEPHEVKAVELEERTMNELEKFKTSSNMILVYDETDNKFTFYNSNKSILGSFNFHQIIKYIGKQIHSKFYGQYESGYSEELIKNMLAEITADPITNKVTIILKSHLNSPFMGNLDLLVKLNNLFHIYEKHNLIQDISSITDDKQKDTVKSSIKQFIYLLINHTLKIISIATEEIKHDTSQIDMRQKLLKYSVALTYRMANFMKEHLESYNSQHKILYGQLEKLINMKSIMNNKLNSLEQKINKQNTLIFSIIKGKPVDETTVNTTEQKFNKLFENDNNDDNYFDSEYIIDDGEDNYLLSDSQQNTSDFSEII